MSKPIRAFTLAELLVVVAIIALLLAILLPTINRGRTLAQQARQLAEIRQVMIGHVYYTDEHRGDLLLGHPPLFLDGRIVKATGPNGEEISGVTAQRYPWRLANYVNDGWKILFDAKEESRALDASTEQYLKGVHPTFGLNSIFVGGHISFYGYEKTNPISGTPNRRGPAAFRNVQVRRTSELIVFSETRVYNGSEDENGRSSFNISPPHALGQFWTVEDEQFVITAGSSTRTVVPQARYGNRAAVSFFDGHAESLKPSRLDDMRLWSHTAEHEDQDVVQEYEDIHE